MAKKATVAIAHIDADLGKPAEYTRGQLDRVKGMIRQIASQTMGGMRNIVKSGDKVMIKINTVIPVPPSAGFTTDPRMLEALIELVKEQMPARIQIGERCAMGADTMKTMEICGIVEVAERTGVQLCPFEHVPFDMYKIDRPVSFNEFPCRGRSARLTSTSGCHDEGSRSHHLHRLHEVTVRQSAGL